MKPELSCKVVLHTNYEMMALAYKKTQLEKTFINMPEFLC